MSLERLGNSRGSALMIALFVIVVIGLLAATMGRFLVDSGDKHATEVRSAQAMMAAQSGLERALYQLFLPRTVSLPTPVGRCDYRDETILFNTPGLQACEATIHCQSSVVTHGGAIRTLYLLTGIGRCGNQPENMVSRTIEVEAYQ